jgi:hypothetical protein
MVTYGDFTSRTSRQTGISLVLDLSDQKWGFFTAEPTISMDKFANQE